MKFSNCGIYIHIPFCKNKCPYCDFYSTVQLKYKQDFIKAILKEIELRKNFITCSPITSIYLGGGTPSLLSDTDLKKIFEFIHKNFIISDKCEITLEANPEDVNKSKSSDWKNLGINRLSLGTQSFNDKTLYFLGRNHTAQDNILAIETIKNAGFGNITIDIIYGIPEQKIAELQNNLNIIFKYEIPHISAYHLGIEENTVFGILHKKNKLTVVDEETSYKHYNFICSTLKSSGYKHYEISNFAKDNFYSMHNAGYWKNMQYLGLGPSAHSYNGKQRSWNVSNLYKYISKVNKGEIFYEIENIDTITKFNEYIMTSLRTCWGIDLDFIKENFGQSFLQHLTGTFNKKYKDGDFAILSNNKIILTEKGLFISDSIILDFLI